MKSLHVLAKSRVGKTVGTFISNCTLIKNIRRKKW